MSANGGGKRGGFFARSMSTVESVARRGKEKKERKAAERKVVSGEIMSGLRRDDGKRRASILSQALTGGAKKSSISGSRKTLIGG